MRARQHLPRLPVRGVRARPAERGGGGGVGELPAEEGAGEEAGRRGAWRGDSGYPGTQDLRQGGQVCLQVHTLPRLMETEIK